MRHRGFRRRAWLPIKVMWPFWKLMRHLVEMSYLWSKPHFLDGGRFDALLPDFDATPIGEALEVALKLEVNPDQPVT